MTSSTTELKAKVLFRFVPENDEELDLHEGDIVKVTEKHDDGWSVAVFNGKIGYVPTSYLEEIPDVIPQQKQRPTKPAPPIPQKPKSEPSPNQILSSNDSNIQKKNSSPSFEAGIQISNCCFFTLERSNFFVSLTKPSLRLSS
jgi:predicted Zn-dependent protease